MGPARRPSRRSARRRVTCRATRASCGREPTDSTSRIAQYRRDSHGFRSRWDAKAVPRRRARIRWGHPLTIAVVVALIGLLGTISAAMITSSDTASNEDEAPSERGDASSGSPESQAVVLEAVSIESQDSVGVRSLGARGIAYTVPPGDAVFAIAQTSPDSELSLWFSSDPVMPDSNGRWSATIAVRPSTPPPLTVMAVVATCVEKCGSSYEPAAWSITRERLALRGPDAPEVVRRSAAVEVDGTG
jgi:hypothetical protein